MKSAFVPLSKKALSLNSILFFIVLNPHYFIIVRLYLFVRMFFVNYVQFLLYWPEKHNWRCLEKRYKIKFIIIL